MEDEKDAFYVVRKGDIIGIYKSFADCQAQAGFSPLDPSISVYKGYCLSKEAESYLLSHGLKQAGFSVGASDVHNGLFGALSVCPFQDSVGSSSSGNLQKKPVNLKNHVEIEAHVGPTGVTVPATVMRIPKLVGAQLNLTSPSPKLERVGFSHTEPRHQVHPACQSCTIEFDGASKGNPGISGAGAVLRASDGSEEWRLREGVGIATNNVAEYRSVILGLRTALQKGYKHVRVRGDSQLVCYQIQGKWKTKNENMAILCKEAKELTNKFASFTIEHVAREFNSDADAQANQAIHLRDGQVEMDVTRSHA